MMLRVLVVAVLSLASSAALAEVSEIRAAQHYGLSYLALQMTAAKEWGQSNFAKLDTLTVSMPHPEAMNALYGGAITAHFSSPPFQYQEVKRPGIRRVLSNYDILGGKATFNVVWTTRAFHDANPKLYAAFLSALESATQSIRRDKRAAAETYIRITGTKESA